MRWNDWSQSSECAVDDQTRVSGSLRHAGGLESGSFCKTGIGWSGDEAPDQESEIVHRVLLTRLLVDPLAEPDPGAASILFDELEVGGVEIAREPPSQSVRRIAPRNRFTVGQKRKYLISR
jgi:hypothetical protein